jgi:hypothetical protein
MSGEKYSNIVRKSRLRKNSIRLVGQHVYMHSHILCALGTNTHESGCDIQF